MMNQKHNEMRMEAIADIIECLDNGFSDYYCDLHNEVFNTDYYIIGRYEAKQALREYDVFAAIERVQEYEESNFDERYIDYSNPEKLVNMLYYTIGEEIISEMNAISEFADNWDNVADDETNAAIIAGMRVLFGSGEE